MANLAKDMGNKGKPREIDYERIANNSKFRDLMKQKKRFLIPSTIFFLLFYFTLPVLTSYTTILNRPAIGPLTWTWVYALAQFVMTWALCIVYVRRATKFDEVADEIVKEYEEGGTRSL